MSKKSSEEITLSNIFSDSINILGVVFSTLLSFIITAACSLSDYTQTEMLIDAVMKESGFTVVICSITICIFLNFSMYVAGTVIKRMSCGKPLGGSTAISVISIVLSFLLFGAVFAVSFKFKYALRDYLFSVDSLGTIDTVINKAVKTGSEVISNTANINIGEKEIINISAVLSGLLPAFTSLMSLLSVFLLYDPLASEKVAVKIKLMYYKYRYYKTKKQLTVVDSEMFQYEQLPLLYGEVLKNDYNAYTQFRQETISAEHTAKTAEYTAAIELFKADQNTVTRLSSEASAIRCRPQQYFENTEVTELPDELLNQISAAEKLFDKRKSGIDALSFTPVALTADAEDTEKYEIPDFQTSLPSLVINPQKDESKEESYDDGDPDSSAADAQPFKAINIPDSMVSPQLSQAVNQ